MPACLRYMGQPDCSGLTYQTLLVFAENALHESWFCRASYVFHTRVDSHAFANILLIDYANCCIEIDIIPTHVYFWCQEHYVHGWARTCVIQAIRYLVGTTWYYFAEYITLLFDASFPTATTKSTSDVELHEPSCGRGGVGAESSQGQLAMGKGVVIMERFHAQPGFIICAYVIHVYVHLLTNLM